MSLNEFVARTKGKYNFSQEEQPGNDTSGLRIALQAFRSHVVHDDASLPVSRRRCPYTIIPLVIAQFSQRIRNFVHGDQILWFTD